MPVVGTAGHVDHGKSTLVRALTGRDPDRWAEEKQRGLTIDLGFAWTELPSGAEVGFVDVPGHERFIKNMLAGVDAITVALLVVAADEGWMPQSEEHLAILDLLDIGRGVVALTRADLVDSDTLELATLEVDEKLAGTSLEGAPIIPTAAPTGTGIDDLRAALDSALAESETLDSDRPRMWVDRSFSIAGAGTVLTGTLTGGSIAVDDSVRVFPEGLDGRIRSIQSHERSQTAIGPGNRTALNVVGIERHDVRRGAMLGAVGDWNLTRRFVADLTAVRDLDAPLRERGSFHLHVGSGSWSARLRLLEDQELRDRGAALIEVSEPLPLQWRDRFILREVGRQAVVAGGVVLDPAPPRPARRAKQVVAPLRVATDPNKAADALLTIRGESDLGSLAAQTGGGEANPALLTRATAYSQDRVESLLGEATTAVESFHSANPLRAGMPRAQLAEHLTLAPDELEPLVQASSSLEIHGADVRQVGFGVDLGPAEQAAWETAREQLRAGGIAPPRKDELRLPVELEHALLRSGELIEVSDDLLYLPEATNEVVERTRSIPDGFSVADFRDALGITRKHAIPLLEWLDKQGVTVRQGDLRTTATD